MFRVMGMIEQGKVPRAIRVVFPVKVDFSGERFEIQEFTENLSVGGLFLPTDRHVEPRTPGSLTFRISRSCERTAALAATVASLGVARPLPSSTLVTSPPSSSAQASSSASEAQARDRTTSR